jgi:hypothetical protein
LCLSPFPDGSGTGTKAKAFDTPVPHEQGRISLLVGSSLLSLAKVIVEGLFLAVLRKQTDLHDPADKGPSQHAEDTAATATK